jgi:hypothetical protein
VTIEVIASARTDQNSIPATVPVGNPNDLLLAYVQRLNTPIDTVSAPWTIAVDIVGNDESAQVAYAYADGVNAYAYPFDANGTTAQFQWIQIRGGQLILPALMADRYVFKTSGTIISLPAVANLQAGAKIFAVVGSRASQTASKFESTIEMDGFTSIRARSGGSLSHDSVISTNTVASFAARDYSGFNETNGAIGIALQLAPWPVVASGPARLAGKGRSAASGLARTAGAARVSGTGGVASAASLSVPLGIRFPALGGFRASASTIAPSQARLAGRGMVEASPRLVVSASGRLEAVGAMGARGTPLVLVRARLVGIGRGDGLPGPVATLGAARLAALSEVELQAALRVAAFARLEGFGLLRFGRELILAGELPLLEATVLAGELGPALLVGRLGPLTLEGELGPVKVRGG